MVKQTSLDLMEVLPNFDLTTEESRYDAGILFSPTNDPSIRTSWSCSSNHDDLKEHESEQQYETMGTTDHDLLQTYRMDLGTIPGSTIPGNEAKKFNLDEIRSTHTELMNMVEIFLTQIGIKFQALKKDNFSCTSEWGTEPYGSFLITCTRTMICGLCALFGKTFCQDAVGVCSSYTVDGDPPHTCFLITTHDGSEINFDDALKITNIICSSFPKLSSQRDETGRYMEFHDYCNECPSITNGDLFQLLRQNISKNISYQSSSEQQQVNINPIKNIPKFICSERAFFNTKANTLDQTYKYVHDGITWRVPLPDISSEIIICSLLSLRSLIVRIGILYLHPQVG
ncbi:unnamed protein product [Rotaria socialis]|uniref:Uncharacterized protein n=1 Tax=Rotaria socialis TaxID=392032 RepID=A0A818E5Y6_9BILA|nr:unnamed protein product [Rotaria socialis]